MTKTPAKKSTNAIQKNITDQIMKRVDDLQQDGLAIPDNYNVANALNSAMLKLTDMTTTGGKKVLEVVTQKSVQESLFNMVLQGLSPAKEQLYFIPYGNELQMQRSYFGTQAVLKRLSGIKDVWANVIFKGDEFEMEIDDKGRERLKLHKTQLANRDEPIVGVYAIVDTTHDGQILTVMTQKEIQKSWGQSRNSKVQKDFPTEMAKRTVINRAAKNIINSSSDSDLLIEAINQTTANEYENDEPLDVEPIKPDEEVEYIDFEEATAVESDPYPKVDLSKEQPVKQQATESPQQEALFDNLTDVQPDF